MEQMNVIEVLGRNYIEGLYESENTESVANDFKIIAAINEELFKHIPYEVVFTENDTYSSAKQMREEIQRTGIIYIYTGWSGHPFLTQEQNNIGRAVHDVFAHCVCGCPFSFQGELNAYYTQREYYPREVWNTLFAEIPMQTAAYYTANGFNFPQRAIRATNQDMQLVAHMKKDYSKNSILKPLQLI